MKLLVLDVEENSFKTKVRLPGTTLYSTIWQAIAKELGLEAVYEEVNTHERWIRGEYDTYLSWDKDTIAIHQRYKFSQSLVQDLIAN